MEQLNRIEIRGIVGAVRHVNVRDESGANFNVATSYAYRDKDGTPVIDTTWFSVVAWESKDIKGLDKLESGIPIEVTGRMRCKAYITIDGSERKIYEVVASKINFIDIGTQLAPAKI